MACYIFNHFIENIIGKYDDKNIIDVQLLKNEKESMTKYDDVEFEMIRIKISCKIDELKDIFYTIKPIREVIVCENDKNLSPVIVSAYVNSNNNVSNDSFRMSILFPNDTQYFLIIEIFRENFTRFMRSDDIEDGAIIFALDHIKFLG